MAMKKPSSMLGQKETDLGSLMFLPVNLHLCSINKPNKLIGSSV